MLWPRPANRAGPVSYTHLTDEMVQPFLYPRAAQSHKGTYGPVSYTHLDVYKRQEVLDMLSVLDGEEKQCLILRLYAKMPYKEIADILRISVASAQKKYQRSVRKLKDFYL